MIKKNINWPMLCDWGLCVFAALRKTSFWICCEQLTGVWYLLCSVRQDMLYAFSKYSGNPCDHAFNFILPSISVWLRQPHKNNMYVCIQVYTCVYTYIYVYMSYLCACMYICIYL